MEVSKPEIIIVITTLAGTIGVLWIMIKSWLKREQNRLHTCENMYAKATEEIKELNGKYNYLQGRMDGVEQLSLSVLEKIQTRRTDDRKEEDA